MNNDTIILEGLSIGYTAKGGTGRTVAADINAALKAGELTCLLGSNGIGKSTLLRTLAAFQKKMGGRIRIRSHERGNRYVEISDMTDKELSRSIGVVLTERPDIRNITVRELVALGRSPYTGFWGSLGQGDWQEVDRAMEAVGIGDMRHRMIHTLSDGERQKVMIAKALAQQTPVILLDEPTAFLDFTSKVEVMGLLRRLAREEGKTVLMSTHDLEIALRMADRIWLMERAEGALTVLSVGEAKEEAEDGVFTRLRKMIEAI